MRGPLCARVRPHLSQDTFWLQQPRSCTRRCPLPSLSPGGEDCKLRLMGASRQRGGQLAAGDTAGRGDSQTLSPLADHDTEQVDRHAEAPGSIPDSPSEPDSLPW